MRKSIIRTHYDPSFQGGEGLFVMRTSVYLNGGRDKNLVEQMRIDDPTSYAYLYLGATKQIGGLAYSGLEHLVYTEQVDTKEILPLSIGIDHANSPDHGDWFAASFLGTDIVTQETDPYGWGYPGFNAKYYYDEYAWNNKLYEFKTDDQFAQEVLEKLIEYVDKNEN